MLSIKLSDLAQQLNAKLYGDGNIIINGIASINNAKLGQITFLSHLKFRKNLIYCRASAVILMEKDLSFCKSAALVVKDPYLTYIKMVRKFINKDVLIPDGTIGIGVVIASNVTLGKKVTIGANSVIESGVIIDNNVIVGSGSFIGTNVMIGSGTHIHSNVSIYHNVKIGKNCFIQSGAVIGSDGFGYVNDNEVWVKIPQLGKVIIGNNVEIGSCTTIDRGSLDDTIISDGVIIDNQCQIAHNVMIGKNTAIAGGVVMAGSLKIGQCCKIGGASVINGHIEICDNVIITGMSMVMKSITKSGTYSSGIPVQLNKVWRKSTILLMNIINIIKRIKIIEQKLINN